NRISFRRSASIRARPKNVLPSFKLGLIITKALDFRRACAILECSDTTTENENEENIHGIEKGFFRNRLLETSSAVREKIGEQIDAKDFQKGNFQISRLG